MGKRKVYSSTRRSNVLKALSNRWSEGATGESVSTGTSTTISSSSLPSSSRDMFPSSSSSSFIVGIPEQPAPRAPSPPQVVSTFQKKLDFGLSSESLPGTSETGERGIFDIDLLCEYMSQFKCPECSSANVKVSVNPTKRKGFAQFLEAYCPICNKVVHSTFSSLPDRNSSTAFGINVDAVTAALQCDIGPYKLNKFCAGLNLPGLSQRTYQKLGGRTKERAISAASAMFGKAASIVREVYGNTDETETLDIGVSFDGTWLTRGHSSLIGVGTVIEIMTGLVLDVHVMSQYCQVCAQTGAWQKKNNPSTYDAWLTEHKKQGCSINFEGASGMMEPEAAAVLWGRSLERHNMRYTVMVGDGDSKAFDRVTSMQPYGPGVIIEKEECMNHISKRLGYHLRAVVQDCSKKGITLGGRKWGSLTAEKIRKLGIYYARAIRAHNNPDDMRTAILASLYHNYSTDAFPQHQYCPSGPDSWCFYKRDLAMGRYPGGHAQRIHTPLDYERLHRHIWPTYERLTNRDLLRKCCRHATQNANESLHHCIWSKCSKTNFHSKSKVEFSAVCAIAEFNFGPQYTLINDSNLGVHAARITAQRKLKRLNRSLDTAHGKEKKREKKRKEAIQKAREESIREHGSVGYGAGQW